MLRSLLISSRPISWVNTAFPFAAAYFLVTREIDLELIVGTIFFLIPYNFLMYGINDVFDYESDLRNPRKGGIEGGLLPKPLHRTVIIGSVLSCMPFVVFLIATGDQWSQFWLLITVLLVLAYSVPGLRFKERPILDSFTSAMHFTGPLLVGLAQAEAKFTWDASLIALAFLLWGAASHAFGAVQDISSDRAAAIGSIATKLGAAWTSRISFALYLVSAALLLGTQMPTPIAAIAVLPYALITGRFWNLSDANCELANKGWRNFLALNFVAGTVVSLLIAWVLRFG